MAKLTVAQIPAKLYELLEPLAPEERTRAVQATMILFGVDTPPEPAGKGPARAAGTTAAASDPEQFFHLKDPQNKGEMLAVAARYRELKGAESHSKADLKTVITGAGRNFDDRNFGRDMDNARRQAGFFILGPDRSGNKLSYYGKQFVDALPNREAAGALKRPKVGGRKKSGAKKKSTK